MPHDPRRRRVPPARIALPGDDGVTLVGRGEVPAEAVYAAVDVSRAHLEPWLQWAHGYVPARASEMTVHAREAWRAGQDFVYVLVDLDGSVAGACGLHRRIGEGGLEIGYWVRIDRVRAGLATRASAVLVDVAFSLDGVERVEIHHDVANAASGGVPRRLGFTEVGRERREPEAPGCSGVQVTWRLTREQWLRRRAATGTSARG